MNNKLNSQFIPKNASQIFIDGPVGRLDCLELKPLKIQNHSNNTNSANINPNTNDINNNNNIINNINSYIGIAIIFHPNPVEGGTYTNKVVQSIAKNLNSRGYLCICPNLRGVGLSDGIHNNGAGEVDDAYAVYNYVMSEYNSDNNHLLPVILAGFSFGSAIASQLATKVLYQKLILVGVAVTRYKVVVSDSSKTTVIHGENDEIIPIKDALEWGKSYDQPIIWVPNTGHFFHGKLSQLQSIINNINFCE